MTGSIRERPARVRWARALLLGLLGAVVVFLALWWNSPGGHQWRAMRAAQAHLDGPMKHDVARAEGLGLQVFVSTAEQIWVMGSTPSRSDFDALRVSIRASHPPCPVRYRVRFDDDVKSVEDSTDPVARLPTAP